MAAERKGGAETWVRMLGLAGWSGGRGGEGERLGVVWWWRWWVVCEVWYVR